MRKDQQHFQRQREFGLHEQFLLYSITSDFTDV